MSFDPSVTDVLETIKQLKQQYHSIRTTEDIITCVGNIRRIADQYGLKFESKGTNDWTALYYSLMKVLDHRAVILLLK